jgi:hypothetical protein
MTDERVPERALPTRVVRARPDPVPSRLAVGVGALAALSVIGAGLVRFPASGTVTPTEEPTPGSHRTTARLERPVRYVRLRPGQQPPPGARVIREAAPTPRVVVRYVAGQSSAGSTARQPVARTRQSGG